MPRFVVLEHRLGAGHARATHWDLMFEQNEVLVTWALEEPPAVGHAVAARSLDAHRLAYLDYEGPLSGDRGEVLRWDAGHYRLVARDDRQWRCVLAGQRLRGVCTLSRDSDDPQRWTCSLDAS